MTIQIRSQHDVINLSFFKRTLPPWAGVIDFTLVITG